MVALVHWCKAEHQARLPGSPPHLSPILLTLTALPIIPQVPWSFLSLSLGPVHRLPFPLPLSGF